MFIVLYHPAIACIFISEVKNGQIEFIHYNHHDIVKQIQEASARMRLPNMEVLELSMMLPPKFLLKMRISVLKSSI